MREKLHSYSVKYFVCFLASILWFGLQNEGRINEWTFARVCFVYASQRFHGSWKQFYFFTSLHFRIETFLSSLWVLSPRLPQLFRQTFEELSEARDDEYKKLTGKAESSDKKKKKMRSAGVASHCDTTLLSHLWMSVQSVSFGEPWTVDRGLQWFQAFPSTAGHLATPGVHVSFLNIMEIKYRLFSVLIGEPRREQLQDQCFLTPVLLCFPPTPKNKIHHKKGDLRKIGKK